MTVLFEANALCTQGNSLSLEKTIQTLIISLIIFSTGSERSGDVRQSETIK